MCRRASDSLARSGDSEKFFHEFHAKRCPFSWIFSLFTLDGIWIAPCPLSPWIQLPPPEVEFEWSNLMRHRLCGVIVSIHPLG
ncbi:hypothetical protein Tco_1562167 [Tanacetum coccineum]